MLVLVISSPSISQTSNAVILYNGKAMQADVSADGDVVNLRGEVKGYMDGFLLKPPTSIAPAKVNVVRSTTPARATAPVVDSRKKAKKLTSTSPPVFVRFVKGSSSLDGKISKQLTLAADQVKAKAKKLVWVTVYSTSEDIPSLISNRSATISDYLYSLGLSSDQVSVNVSRKGKMANSISIKLVE